MPPRRHQTRRLNLTRRKRTLHLHFCGVPWSTSHLAARTTATRRHRRHGGASRAAQRHHHHHHHRRQQQLNLRRVARRLGRAKKPQLLLTWHRQGGLGRALGQVLKRLTLFLCRRGVPWSQLGAPRGGIYTYWRVFELAVWQLGLKGRQVCDRRAAGKTT